MTTTVPKVFSFHEFARVAEAVADHVVHAQNSALEEREKPLSASSGGGFPNGGTGSGFSSQVRIAPSVQQQVPSPQQSPPQGQHVQLQLQGSPRSSQQHQQIDQQLRQSPSVPQTPQFQAHNSSQQLGKSSSGRIFRNGSISQSSKNKKGKERRFKIAISGGSLIQVLHEGLLKRTDIQWGKWDIYFADERLVPFASKESNYGQAKRQIFDLIDTEKYGQPNVYHIDESLIDDPQECADSYEKVLIKGFAGRDSVKLPMFDLLLLGCAPDGHIASLFPNFQESLRERFAWVIPITNAPSGPSNRVSLTIPVICHSHQVTFVVEGATKAPVIKTIMERPEKGLPSSIVNEGAAGRVSWFVDDDALSDVMVTKKVYKFLSVPQHQQREQEQKHST